MRQKRILLRLIKAMDFINKQNCPETQIPILPGVFDHPFDIFLATSHRRQLDELRIDLAGDNSRQGRLARPWWTPQNQTNRLSALHDLTEQLTLAQQMALSDHLIQFLRPHLFGQGLSIHIFIIPHSHSPVLYSKMVVVSVKRGG